MRFINRKVPIADVAHALGLRLDGALKIHCWHPERHQNGDRTASVGIRVTNNTVKCFGCCDFKPIGPIDLVMDVLELGNAEAALWIAARFKVPTIPRGKRITEPGRFRHPVGVERGLGLLVRSGLFGILSRPGQAIAAVLLEMAHKEQSNQEFAIQISYAAISRYSGIRSPNAVCKALTELTEIGFLRRPEVGLGRSPARQAAHYIVTPNSEQLIELGHAFSAQMRAEIGAERELRARLKSERVRALKERSRHTGLVSTGAGQGGSNAALLPHSPIPAQKELKTNPSPAERIGTKYKPLYPTNSANQQPAIPRIARSSTPGPGIDPEVNG